MGCNATLILFVSFSFQVWEYGIPLCKELADYYEENFEYKKLGDILVSITQLTWCMLGNFQTFLSSADFSQN